jgi:hypothetical protein
MEGNPLSGAMSEGIMVAVRDIRNGEDSQNDAEALAGS